MFYSKFFKCVTQITSELWNCKARQVRGFMRTVCRSRSGNTKEVKIKCHNSEEMYDLNRGEKFNIRSGGLCSRDPHFYQACKRNSVTTLRNDDLLCGVYLCMYESNIYLNFKLPLLACNGIKDCQNTDLDEAYCTGPGHEMTTMLSGKSVPSREICNNVCFDRTCEDEAVCNGYTYGLYCDFNPTTNTSTYVRVLNVCDRQTHCDDGTDEINCLVQVTDITQPTCEFIGHKNISSDEKNEPIIHKGPSIKDVRKNLPFFDPPSPPRPGVSEITDHPPPRTSASQNFFAI